MTTTNKSEETSPDGFVEKFTVLKSAPRELWLVYFGKVMETAAYGLFNMGLMLYLINDLEYSDEGAGTFVGIWATLIALFTFLVGSLSDAVGVRKTLIFSFALCVGTLLLFRKKQAMAKVIIIVAVASFLAIAILPVGTWLLIPLENRFQPPGSLPHNVRGIIVLGGAFENKLILARRQLVLKNSGERILTFFQLAKQYPKARLIFAGGSGSLGPRGLGDSLPAKPFFDQMGIDFCRVILESLFQRFVVITRLFSATPDFSTII